MLNTALLLSRCVGRYGALRRACRERQPPRERRRAWPAELQRFPTTTTGPCSGPPSSPGAAGGTARPGLTAEFRSHPGPGSGSQVTGGRGRCRRHGRWRRRRAAPPRDLRPPAGEPRPAPPAPLTCPPAAPARSLLLPRRCRRCCRRPAAAPAAAAPLSAPRAAPCRRWARGRGRGGRSAALPQCRAVPVPCRACAVRSSRSAAAGSGGESRSGRHWACSGPGRGAAPGPAGCVGGGRTLGRGVETGLGPCGGRRRGGGAWSERAAAGPLWGWRRLRELRAPSAHAGPAVRSSPRRSSHPFSEALAGASAAGKG